jgi:hypothetical protein
LIEVGFSHFGLFEAGVDVAAVGEAGIDENIRV